MYSRYGCVFIVFNFFCLGLGVDVDTEGDIYVINNRIMSLGLEYTSMMLEWRGGGLG